MKIPKKPTWYYVIGSICAIGVIGNLFNGEIIGAAVFGALSFIFLYLASIKNAEYKENLKIYLSELNAYGKIKDYYRTIENNSADLEQIKLELLNTNNFSEIQISELAEKAAKEYIENIVKSETSTQSLSPDGYNRIFSLAKKANIDLKFDDKTTLLISKYRRNWEIDNGDLPTYYSSISLQKGEVLHYENKCSWYENRTITKSIGYHGLAGSFRIAKGIRYRVGNINLQRVKEDKLLEIDRGNVFITNKRIIFMGSKLNKNIKYSSILSITPYSDGVGIEKDAGKSPILICNDADTMARILARLNN